MGKHKNRSSVEVVNPRPGSPERISRERAQQHCDTGVAYWTVEGRLKFRETRRTAERERSDAYVSGKSTIRVVNTHVSRLEGSPRMPVLQWLD